MKRLSHACLFFFVLLAGGLVLTSCDLASAGSTVILNAGSPIPPTVQHRFEYTRDDVTEGGTVDVVSTVESDGLDAILSENGFRRSDVVSARVDSVLVEPVSAVSLSAAALYLGTDANGPRIADVEFPSGSPSPVLDASLQVVTGAVRAGASNVFARFRADDPSNIPSGGGVVRARVYYRVEVEGI